MASDALNVVRDLAARGATHFHASYVAKEAGIPVGDARERLEKLREEGLVDVHFEVVCPGCDRTISSFDLGQKVPYGEAIDDDECDAEPFELTEDEILVTYSPSRDLLLRINRDTGPESAKKKRAPRRGLLRRISSTLRPFMRSIQKLGRSTSISTTSTSSPTAPTRTSRKPRVIAQR
jgi:hypothetical protein